MKSERLAIAIKACCTAGRHFWKHVGYTVHLGDYHDLYLCMQCKATKSEQREEQDDNREVTQ